MFNPWLSFSLQAARLGWKAQNAMVAGFFNLARGNASEPTPTLRMSDKMDPTEEIRAVAPTQQVEGVATRAAAQKVVKTHKEASGGRKPRRAK